MTLPRLLAVVCLVAAAAGMVAPDAPARATAASTTVTAFQAPLVEGIAADPSITYHAGSYYLIYNKGGFNDSDNRYAYYQYIVMRKASSLAALTDAPDQVIYRGSQLPAEISNVIGQGAWLLPWQGRHYIYAWGDDGRGNSHPFVLESTTADPAGPYQLKAILSVPLGAGYGFAAAPHLIGGRLYLTQTQNGRIYLATMSNPWTLTSGWSAILPAPSQPWECHGACWNEGGSILVRGSKVFLIFSANWYDQPDYCVGMASADVGASLLAASSWTKNSGCVFSRRDEIGAYGPGSMIAFKSPDGSQDWVIYHIKTTSQITGADRALQAKQVTWNPDGTPTLGQPHATDTYQQVPSGDPGKQVYEAEDAVVTHADVRSSSFASSSSYVGGIDFADSAVQFTVTAPAVGRYPVKVWYANQTPAASTHTLTVNGGASITVRYPPTHSWGRFPQPAYTFVGVKLNAGVNTLRFTRGAGFAELDKLQLWSAATYDGVAVAARDTQHLDVYALDANDRLRSKAWFDPTGWSGWFDPGTTAPPAGLAGPPAAVSRQSWLLDVFAVGRDGQLWTKYWDSVQWHDWSALGAPPPGVAAAGTAVAARGPENLDVYVLGADRRVWSRAWTLPGGWGSWFVPPVPAGGELSVGGGSAPAAVARNAAAKLDVFVTGADGTVWATWWDTARWHNWYPIDAPPGGATSAPAVASRAPDKLDVYVRGADGKVWSRAWTDAAGWGEWFVPSTGGPGTGTTASPGAVSRHAAGAQLDVYTGGPGGQVWTSWWNGANWNAWGSIGTP